jgi:hypothetical protein
VEDDPTVLVEPVPGGAVGGPRLFFQRVPEPKPVKNRVHPDVVTADLDAEIARLVELGATVHSRFDDHVVLQDPEGNECCLYREE